MKLFCKSIPFHSIHQGTQWNLHPWELGEISTELHESFCTNGILHPPLVQADTGNTYQLVAGARRVEFLKKHSEPAEIDCMVIGEDVTERAVLSLILTDQSSSFKLSLAEKARFIEIACRSLTLEEVMTLFQGQLDIKNGRRTIPKLLKLLQQDEAIVKASHNGLLREKMVSELLSLPKKDDRIALVNLFTSLAMGDGKQRRFYQLLRDIAYREGSSLSTYLEKREIKEILNHQELNIPQKIQHLSSLLQKKLSPLSSMAEKTFSEKVTSLKLPTNYTLSHSPSFEKDEVTLSIKFKNFADCKNFLDRQ